MELTDALLAQTGAYLSGQMNESERQDFEARLRRDPDLQREVVLQHELRQGLSLMAQQQRFKTMHTDLMQRGLLTPEIESDGMPEFQQLDNLIPLRNRTATIWPAWSYRYVAASAVLLAGMGGFYFWKQSMPTEAERQREKAFYSAFYPRFKISPHPTYRPRPAGRVVFGTGGSTGLDSVAAGCQFFTASATSTGH